MTEYTPEKYRDMVKALAKPGEAIQSTLNQKENLVNLRVLCGVIMELIFRSEQLDAAKKRCIYEKSLLLLPYDSKIGMEFEASLATKVVTRLTPEMCHLLHMAIGIIGEAGELLKTINDHIVFEKPLDHENIMEELGDLQFYMEGLMSSPSIDTTTEAVRWHNMMKLAYGPNARYKAGTYSNEAAIKREDKEPEPAPTTTEGTFLAHSDPNNKGLAWDWAWVKDFPKSDGSQRTLVCFKYKNGTYSVGSWDPLFTSFVATRAWVATSATPTPEELKAADSAFAAYLGV